MNHSLTLKDRAGKMKYIDKAYADRIDAFCIELLSISEHYFGREVSGSFLHKNMPSNNNVRRLATQFGVLNNLLASLAEVGQAGQVAVSRGYEALTRGEIADPIPLSKPRSPSEFFRRDFLRGLFNAVRVRNESGKMVSFQLGGLWFRSDDDPPRLDMRIPE